MKYVTNKAENAIKRARNTTAGDILSRIYMRMKIDYGHDLSMSAAAIRRMTGDGVYNAFQIGTADFPFYRRQLRGMADRYSGVSYTSTLGLDTLSIDDFNLLVFTMLAEADMWESY